MNGMEKLTSSEKWQLVLIDKIVLWKLNIRDDSKTLILVPHTNVEAKKAFAKGLESREVAHALESFVSNLIDSSFANVRR